MNINDRVRELEEQRRRRAVMASRFCSNIRHLANLATAILVLALGWFAGTWVKIPFPGDDTYPVLVTIWDYAVMLLVWILSVLFTLAILAMPPLHAKSIESGLQHIALIDRYGFSPALVSNQGLKHSNIRDMDKAASRNRRCPQCSLDRGTTVWRKKAQQPKLYCPHCSPRRREQAERTAI